MAAKKVGRPRRFETPDDMEKAWEEFKDHCNNYTIQLTEFSQKVGAFVTQKVNKPKTVTILAFANFCGFSQQAFYEYYANDERFVGIVSRMREECEIDVREKFEAGAIPTQLAALWMSKHGYTTKTDDDKKIEPVQIIIQRDDK